MKKLFIISLIIFIQISCSKKIHENYSSNRYTSKFNTHIFNDSLELYFKSPADIEYTTNKKKLKKILKKNKSLKSVLIYGITDEYEFFIIHSSDLDIIFPEYEIQFDTIIEDKKISFLGHTIIDNTENILKADLSDMFKSLVIGENYINHKLSIFDIVNKYNKSNVFFKAVKEITNFPSYDESSKWNKLQMELTFSSYLGSNEYYENAIKMYEEGILIKPEILQTIENKSITSNIISEIINDAKDKKLLMINENHFYPNHRLFVLDLYAYPLVSLELNFVIA